MNEARIEVLEKQLALLITYVDTLADTLRRLDIDTAEALGVHGRALETLLMGKRTERTVQYDP